MSKKWPVKMRRAIVISRRRALGVIWLGHLGNKFDEFLSFEFCLRFVLSLCFKDSIMAHFNPCIIYLATFRLHIFVCDGGSYIPI